MLMLYKCYEIVLLNGEYGLLLSLQRRKKKKENKIYVLFFTLLTLVTFKGRIMCSHMHFVFLSLYMSVSNGVDNAMLIFPKRKGWLVFMTI